MQLFRKHFVNVLGIAAITSQLWAFGCFGAEDDSPSSDGGSASASDGGSTPESGGSVLPPAPSCSLQGNACVGTADCCGRPITGHRFDRDRQCIATSATPLRCRLVPGSDGFCGMNGLSGCVVRKGDEQDEVYLTAATWSSDQLPGFQPCSDELKNEVLASKECP